MKKSNYSNQMSHDRQDRYYQGSARPYTGHIQSVDMSNQGYDFGGQNDALRYNNLRNSAEGKGAIRSDPSEIRMPGAKIKQSGPGAIHVTEGHHHKTNSLQITSATHNQPLNSQPSSKQKVQQLLHQSQQREMAFQIVSSDSQFEQGHHMKNQKSMPNENAMKPNFHMGSVQYKLDNTSLDFMQSEGNQKMALKSGDNSMMRSKKSEYKKGPIQEMPGQQLPLQNSKKPHIVMNQDFHVKKKPIQASLNQNMDVKQKNNVLIFSVAPEKVAQGQGMSPSQFKPGTKIAQIFKDGSKVGDEQQRKILKGLNNPTVGHKKANSLMNQKIITSLLNREPSNSVQRQDPAAGFGGVGSSSEGVKPEGQQKILSSKQINGPAQGVGGTFQINNKQKIDFINPSGSAGVYHGKSKSFIQDTQEKYQQQIISASVDNSQVQNFMKQIQPIMKSHNDSGGQNYIMNSKQNSSSATPSTTYQLLSNGNDLSNAIRTATQQTNVPNRGPGQIIRPQYPQGSLLPSHQANASNGRGNSESEEQKQQDKQRILSSSYGRTSSRHIMNQQSSSGQTQFSQKYNLGIKHQSFHHNPTSSHKSKHLPQKSIVSQQDSLIGQAIPSNIPSGIIPPGFVTGHQSMGTSSTTNLNRQPSGKQDNSKLGGGHHRTQSDAVYVANLNLKKTSSKKGMIAGKNPLNKNTYVISTAQHVVTKKRPAKDMLSNISKPLGSGPKKQSPQEVVGSVQQSHQKKKVLSELPNSTQLPKSSKFGGIKTQNTQDHRHNAVNNSVHQQDYSNGSQAKSTKFSQNVQFLSGLPGPKRVQPKKNHLKTQVHPPYPKTTQQTLEPPQEIQNQAIISQVHHVDPSDQMALDSRSAGCMALGTINTHCEEAAEAEFNMIIQSDNQGIDSSYQGLSKDTTPRDIIRTFNVVHQPNFILHQPHHFHQLQSVDQDQYLRSDLDEVESVNQFGKILSQQQMISRTEGQGPLASRVNGPHFSDNVASTSQNRGKIIQKKPANQPQHQPYIGPPSSSSGSFAGKSHKRSVSDGGIFNNQGLKAKASQMSSQNQEIPTQGKLPLRKKPSSGASQKALNQQKKDTQRQIMGADQIRANQQIGTNKQMAIPEEGDDEQQDCTNTLNTEGEENVRTEMGQEHLTAEGFRIMQPSGSLFAATGGNKKHADPKAPNKPLSVNLMNIEENTPTGARPVGAEGATKMQKPATVKQAQITRVKKPKPKSQITGGLAKKSQDDPRMFEQDPQGLAGSQLDSKDHQYITKSMKYKQMRKNGEYGGTALTASVNQKGPGDLAFQYNPQKQIIKVSSKKKIAESQVVHNFDSQTQDQRKDVFQPLDFKHRRVKSGATGMEPSVAMINGQQKVTGRQTNMKAVDGGKKVIIFKGQQVQGPKNVQNQQTKAKKPKVMEGNRKQDIDNKPAVFNYGEQQRLPPNSHIIKRKAVDHLEEQFSGQTRPQFIDDDNTSENYNHIGEEGLFYEEDSSANIINSHQQSVDAAAIGGAIGYDQHHANKKKVINVSFNDFPSISNGDNFSQSGAITEGQNDNQTPFNNEDSGIQKNEEKQPVNRTQQSSNIFNKFMQALEKIKPENPSAQSPLHNKLSFQVKPNNKHLQDQPLPTNSGHKKTKSETTPVLHQNPIPNKPISISSQGGRGFSASSGRAEAQQVNVQYTHNNPMAGLEPFRKVASKVKQNEKWKAVKGGQHNRVISAVTSKPVHLDGPIETSNHQQISNTTNHSLDRGMGVFVPHKSVSPVHKKHETKPSGNQEKVVMHIFHHGNVQKYSGYQNIHSPSGSNTGGQPSPIISTKRIPQKLVNNRQVNKQMAKSSEPIDSHGEAGVMSFGREQSRRSSKNQNKIPIQQNNFVFLDQEQPEPRALIPSDYAEVTRPAEPAETNFNNSSQQPKWSPETNNILRKKNLHSQTNQTTSTPIIQDRGIKGKVEKQPYTQHDEDYSGFKQGVNRPKQPTQGHGKGKKQKQIIDNIMGNDSKKKSADLISDLDSDPIDLIHNLNKGADKYLYPEKQEVERIKIIHKPMPKTTKPQSIQPVSKMHSKKPSNIPTTSQLQMQAPVQTPKAPQVSERREDADHATQNSQLRCVSMATNERLVTEESNNNQLTPRSKGIRKLVKMIRLCFKQSPPLAPETTIEFYRIGKILGKGAFGKVNLAVHKLTQCLCAIKSINKQFFSDESQTRKVMQEVFILKKVKHQNIVRLFEYFETEKHILFVIELCAGGDLLNYVRRRRRLKEDVAKCLFKQMVESLAYCHNKNILHRDIKLDNIMLDANGQVKIGDFGVGKIVKKGEKMTEQCGTPAYIAPEILRDNGYYGFAVDIWSAGVVLYAMLYGTVPFKASNMSELQQIIMKAKYTLKDDISADSRDLLKKLLEKDPEKRITIKDILSHPWLGDAPDPKDVELFSEAERQYISSEYSYAKSTRYGRNKETAGMIQKLGPACSQLFSQAPGDVGSNPFEVHDIGAMPSSELDKDMFTEHMLDSTQNSILKNCETKSIILAPFNSTKSNLNPDSDLQNIEISDSVKELIVSRRVIHFGPRVRDIDKQYEINNNADLDNGVFHNFENEDEKEEEEEGKETNQSALNTQSHQNVNDKRIDTSNFDEILPQELDQEEKEILEELKRQGQKKKCGNADKMDLEKLENMIHNQEEKEKADDVQLSMGLLNQQTHDYAISEREADYGGGNVVTENSNPNQMFIINQHQNIINIKEENKESLQNSIMSSPKEMKQESPGKQHLGMKIMEDESAESLLVDTAKDEAFNKLLQQQILNEHIPIDDSILSQAVEFGYPRDYILKCMNGNELNYATTCYLLLYFSKQNYEISQHYELRRQEREQQEAQ